MEDNAVTNSTTPPTATPIVPETTVNTNDTVSSPLLKRPMIWLGLGAVLIIVLGAAFLMTGKSKQSSTPAQSTEQVVVEPTGTIEIHEQTEADAIEVGDIDEDFNDINKDVNQL